jgi:hypothetical protein
MDDGGLVAAVDDANAVIDADVIDADDRVAVQAEDRVDALGLQGTHEQIGAGYKRHGVHPHERVRPRRRSAPWFRSGQTGVM